MPSVVKSESDIVQTEKPLKDRVWSIENFSRWVLKWIIAIGFFYIILLTILPLYIDYNDNLGYLGSIFISYIISNIIAFFLAYLIVRYIAKRFFKRKVKRLGFRKSFKKFFIQLVKFIFLTFIYYFGLRYILTQSLTPYMPEYLAFFLVWVGIGIFFDLIAALLYYLLKLT